MTALTIDGHEIHVLFSEDQIARRVQAIAEEVARQKPARLLVVPILKGSFVFAADLIRAFHRADLRPEVAGLGGLEVAAGAPGPGRDPLQALGGRHASPWGLTGAGLLVFGGPAGVGGQTPARGLGREPGRPP